jgi:3'-phosphoadenosine 5'-phosphosulfate sulfotransferase (PAPS reductase)/FAD synthetase
MPKKEFHIVSFSGGKDSTAMLLKMVELDMVIDEIIFCDTGKEFPDLYKHIQKVEKYINRKITVVRGEKTFEEYLSTHVKRNGRVGYSFPDWKRRWCTTFLKITPYKRYLKQKYGKSKIIEYIGIAFDEIKRTKKDNGKNRIIKYPLVDWKMTEAESLKYCYEKGFDWNGLYEKFSRVSCYLCPLSKLGELKIVYKEFPELWQDIRSLDKKSSRRFRSDYSVEQLEKKFDKEA